jgi:hypothetical protein
MATRRRQSSAAPSSRVVTCGQTTSTLAETATLPDVINDAAWLPPFRRRDAPCHDLKEADVRRLLASGDLVRLAYGILIGRLRAELATEDPDVAALRALAMLQRYPLAVAARRTAAAIHGLWLIGPAGPVHLYRLAGFPRENVGVVAEPVVVPADQLAVVRGAVTPGPRAPLNPRRVGSSTAAACRPRSCRSPLATK